MNRSNGRFRRAETRQRKRICERLTRRSRMESLEQRLLLTASPWQNPARPLDVNNDGQATALDALIVVNRLQEDQPELGLRTNPLSSYFDVSGDDRVSALDALQIINGLDRADSGEVYSTQRLEGESEVAPAGFVSVMFGELPGDPGQQVELTTTMSVGAEPFHEFGLFVVDTPQGHVAGRAPGELGYADAVFSFAQRQVVYSRQDVFQTERLLTFEAGQTLGAYVLQQTTAIGDSAAHLRVSEPGLRTRDIGWEQHATHSWLYSVGDRGYDDVRVDVQIGEPFSGNAPPNISAIADRTIDELTTVAINIPATDPDGDVLTYSLVSGPVGATVNSMTGQFSWTPSEQQGPGNYPIAVAATDSLGMIADAGFSIQVDEVNAPPVLSTIPTQTIDELETLSIQLQAVDSDIPVNTLSYSLASGPAGASVSASTGQLTWTPSEDEGPGVHDFTVGVSDALGGIDTTSFMVNVREVNQPPILSDIADQTVDELNELIVQAAANDSDTPANSLTYSVVQGPNGLTIDPATGAIRWTPTEAQGPSSEQVVIRAEDGGGESDERGFRITVNEVNRSPMLAAVADQSVDELTELSIQLSATDEDRPSNMLSYAISQGPVGATVEPNTGLFSWTPTESQGPGDYTVSVQVVDSSGASDTQTFQVEVAEVNRPPVLAEVQDRSIGISDALVVTLSASDPDVPDNTLTYSIDQAPVGAIIEPDTGVLQWTPSSSQGSGSYTFDVRATDDGSPARFDTTSFVVTVGDLPQLSLAIDDGQVNELEELSFAIIATGTIPTDNLVYTIENGPDGAAIETLGSVSRFVWTPSEHQGPATVENIVITATDSTDPSRTTSDEFRIVVNEVNQAPVLQPIGNVLVQPGDPVQLTALASDADIPANTLVFSLEPGAPVGASIDSTTGAFEWVTPADFGASQTIGIRVSDGDLSDLQTFNVGIPVVTCSFADGLPGWSVAESGGDELPGSVAADNCDAVITEGDSFVVTLATSFIVPNSPQTLSFNYEADFDNDDLDFINDAFEVALIDQFGNSLVDTYVSDRDAFLNLTEDDAVPTTGGDAIASGGTVTVDISDVLPGEEATLVFRLANNDNDVTTTVRIKDVELPAEPIAQQQSRSGLQSGSPIAQPPDAAPGALTTIQSQTLSDFSTLNVSHDRSVSATEIESATYYYVDWAQFDLEGGTASGTITLPDSSVIDVTFVALNSDGSPATLHDFKDNDSDDPSHTDNQWIPDEPYVSESVLNAPSLPDNVFLVGGPGITYTATFSEPLKNPIMPILSLGRDNQPRDYVFDSSFSILSQGLGFWRGTETSLVQSGNTLTGSEGHGTIRFDETLSSISWEIPVAEVTHAFTFGIGTYDTLDAKPLALTVSSPVPNSPIGSSVLLSGLASPSGNLDQGPSIPNGIDRIEVNGSPVDVLDAQGRFYESIIIEPGVNDFTFVAHDLLGQTATATVSITGTDFESEIDFNRFSDITSSLTGVYGRTSFRADTDSLYVDLATRNDGSSSDAPLLVAVENISDPLVQVVNPDGVTPGGLPYFDFTDLIGDRQLNTNEISANATVEFSNPTRSQFDYELVFFGKLNEAPIVTSVPVIESPFDALYRYDLDAIDPDDDMLEYGFIVNPDGMTMDPTTGVVSWEPTIEDIGLHEVAIQVRDGRGGIAQQRFTVSVTEAQPNRPPVITSTPVTVTTLASQNGLNSNYAYQVEARDPDRDLLAYALAESPSGMGIDSTTGLIVWSPMANQVGNHPVTVVVNDGNGGIAQQSFIVCVHPDPTNFPPTIVSTPVTEIVGPFVQTFVNTPVIELQSEWPYKVVDHGELQGFEAFDFDASSFDFGQAAFGGKDPGLAEFGCPLNLTNRNTDWPTRTDILLRRHFDLPAGTTNVSVNIQIDNDLQVFFNGTDITQRSTFDGCPSPRFEQRLEVSADLLIAGQNLLAIRGHDRGGESYIDAQVFARVPQFPDATNTGQSVYEYQVESNDPDDNNVRYTLTEGPSGMSIDSVSGLVTWPVPPNISGVFDVGITAHDGLGGVDVQEFQLNVKPAGSGRIAGTKYEDANGDGSRQQATEAGLKDWTIYLDQNRNGVRDAGELFTITDAAGQYEFVGLAEGTYYVAEELQPGWAQTQPSDASSINVDVIASQSVSGVDFGNLDLGDAENGRPEILPSTINSVELGDLFRYDAVASDPDNDPLTFSLPLAPEGMTVHPSLGSVVWVPNEAQTGSHDAILRVTDGRGGARVQSFIVEVTPPNNDPVITSVPMMEAVAGRTYSYRLRAQDADGDMVGFSLLNPPAGMTIDSVERNNSAGELIEMYDELTWVVPASAAGTTPTVTVVADDGRGGQDTQSFSLTVLDAATANVAPEVTSTPPLVARFGREWIYQVEAQDADGDPLSYTLSDPPDGMAVDQFGLVTWTPTENESAVSDVVLFVDDGRRGSTRHIFPLRVESIAENQTPTITSVPPEFGVLDQLYVYDPVGFDPERDELMWELTTSPRGMSIDALTGSIRWTPDDLQLGTHTIDITVTDRFLGQSTQQYQLHIGCNNLAPAIISIPPTTALADRPYLYAAGANDPENDPLEWTLLGSPDGMSIDQETGIIRWQPTSSQIGSAEVVVEVDDGLNTSTQSFTIIVSDPDDLVDPSDPTKGTKGNRAPVITSTPVFAADTGMRYEYQVTGLDPDGDAITFGLGAGAPAGLTISDGLISWPQPVTGEYPISVVATDQHGASSTQGYLLSVIVNSQPTIASVPDQTVTSGALYRFAVAAADPDGDPLTYRLDQAPEGMTINQFGRIFWQTNLDDTDPQLVTVTVSDNRGESISESWQLTMQNDVEPPEVTITILSAAGAVIGDAKVGQGSAYSVRVSATDNVGIAETGLSVNGQAVPLDSTGAARLTADVSGIVQLIATATDVSGLSGSAESTVEIQSRGQNNNGNDLEDPPPNPGVDPGDNNPPVVEITSPTPATTVTNRVSIVGTVDDPEDNLWYYRAYYARADRVSLTGIDVTDPNWVAFHQGTAEVIDDELAVFDPSLVTNDPYAIIVAAFDTNGRGFVHPTLVYVEGNVQVGNFRLEFTDLSIPLAGIPIEVNRVYDTVNAGDEGDFGFGWQLGVQDARIFEAAAVGEGGAFNGANDTFVPDVTKVYLNNPAGQRVGFTYREEPISVSFFGAFFRPYFEPDPGVYDTLTIDETEVARGGVLGALAQGINPDKYTLTTKDGLEYRYDEVVGLETITDRNGNTVSFTEDGVVHSSGESIQFIRDHRDRITQIVDPAGNSILYEYDLAGDLKSVTDQAELTTTYSYLDDPAHYLDEAFDSLGRRALKAVYDSDADSGQLVFKGVINASGNRVDDQDFDTDQNIGIVRDGNGNATTIVYDDRGNVLTETDPLGNVTTREYSDDRNPDLETRIIDRRGFVVDQEYDERGNLTSISERGHQDDLFASPTTTEFSYNDQNDVMTITNALGHTTSFEYDNAGNLTVITNALGDSSSFTYDSLGRRNTFTDFNGNTTTFEYSSGDQPTRVTFADATYQLLQYNQFGQVTLEEFYEADNTLVQRSATKYDDIGRVVEEIAGAEGDPDHPPTIVRKHYDGQLLDWEIIVNPESPDETPGTPVESRLSRITDFEYDDNDRLIRQIDAEGGVVEFRYDANGNRVLLQDPVGNITTWVYDELDRVVEERDPFYWVELVESQSDLGSLSSDELLERIAPIDPVSPGDPSDTRDPLYDDSSVVDLAANIGADHIRAFRYDGEGNQTKLIDRNGRRREFAYDHAGRMLEETWFTAETGTLVETISFTYDSLGNQLTASDSNSKYRFEYDSLNRQTLVDNNPDGSRNIPRVILSYEYDAQGNLTGTQDDSGVTVHSEYDERNRLKVRRWLDADGNSDVDDARVDFVYNAIGRKVDVIRFTDLAATSLVGRTERTYDRAGRSDALTHRNSADDIIAGYDYDYDFTGLLTREERTNEDEVYSQSIVYRYDKTAQLVEALFSGQDDETYDYDANGNRSSASLGTETRTYVTGTANRYESDGRYGYVYDGEGNQSKRIDGLTGETRTFQYDHRNRLVKIDDWDSDPGDPQNPTSGNMPSQSVEYTYDVDSRRVARSVDADGSDQGVAEREFYVHNGDNVWADVTSTGEVVHYLFGSSSDEILLRSTVNGGTSGYLSDRLGTIRSVAGPVGEILVSYNYTTFGQVIDEQVNAIEARFLFNGREFDPNTGSYFYRSREYESINGVFGSEDTIGFNGGDANLRRFVGNSPTNATDPTGNTILVESRVTKGVRIAAGGTLGAALGGAVGLGIAFTAILGCGIVDMVVGGENLGASNIFEPVLRRGITAGLTFGAITGASLAAGEGYAPIAVTSSIVLTVVDAAALPAFLGCDLG